jgi:hypothetical protein
VRLQKTTDDEGVSQPRQRTHGSQPALSVLLLDWRWVPTMVDLILTNKEESGRANSRAGTLHCALKLDDSVCDCDRWTPIGWVGLVWFASVNRIGWFWLFAVSVQTTTLSDRQRAGQSPIITSSTKRVTSRQSAALASSPRNRQGQPILHRFSDNFSSTRNYRNKPSSIWNCCCAVSVSRSMMIVQPLVYSEQPTIWLI